jgi:hypothetical protein
VLASFEHREKRFLQSAQGRLQRREYPEAVVELAGGYFYGQNDKKYIPDPEKDETVAELRRLGFFDYTE